MLVNLLTGANVNMSDYITTVTRLPLQIPFAFVPLSLSPAAHLITSLSLPVHHLPRSLLCHILPSLTHPFALASLFLLICFLSHTTCLFSLLLILLLHRPLPLCAS